MSEENLFKGYYEECLATPPGGRQETKPAEDALWIKPVIDGFVTGINKSVAELLVAEKARGTRSELIVTILLGAVAFVLANIFNIIKRALEPGMSEAQYWKTFTGIYESALRDLRRGI
ncbi:MAG: hypothetical protein FD189_1298 [Elusimicrobia bacterium]|nr:MAG: hypothetical protein FD154_1522 [Elusimicrobiota bacterium]KAF0155705.1 MAG: hypothetical protein FD189_1298 [Elusimicrobiota bacterium]